VNSNRLPTFLGASSCNGNKTPRNLRGVDDFVGGSIAHSTSRPAFPFRILYSFQPWGTSNKPRSIGLPDDVFKSDQWDLNGRADVSQKHDLIAISAGEHLSVAELTPTTRYTKLNHIFAWGVVLDDEEAIANNATEGVDTFIAPGIALAYGKNIVSSSAPVGNTSGITRHHVDVVWSFISISEWQTDEDTWEFSSTKISESWEPLVRWHPLSSLRCPSNLKLPSHDPMRAIAIQVLSLRDQALMNRTGQ